MPGPDEPVRLPGIINMEVEANKLVVENSEILDQAGKLLLNIPLQISIDAINGTAKTTKKNVFSPSGKHAFSRSESVDARQRRRSRELLLSGGSDKAGQKSRIRSASAGRDKRTEMAAR